VTDESPSLEEVRARLRMQGYLDSGMERAIFTAPRASGAILPSAVTGALACAIASAGAVAARGGASPALGVAAVAVVLFALELPLALVAGGVFLLIARLGRAPSRPARSSFFAGIAAALLVFGLFVAGLRSVPEGPGSHPVAALLAVTVAAFYFARAARATTLSLALRRHVPLPGRLGRRGSAAVLALTLAFLSLYALRRRPGQAFPALTIAPREGELVVVGLDGVTPESLALLVPEAPIVTWRRPPAPPPEAWTTIATGVTRARHGVAAYERVSLFGSIALSPPAGTAWSFRGPLRWLGAAGRLPVSGAQRRAYAFWEIAARAGVPTVAVNWWASESVPGARVVENRDVARRARSGEEDDAEAIAAFRRLREATSPRLSALYLPGADIDGGPVSKAARSWLDAEIARARTGAESLWVIADAGRSGRAGGWALIDRESRAGAATARPEDVAPTAISRLGLPAARDLAGEPLFALFRKGALETASVPAYGDRLASPAATPTETGREYLEKLKSLGYLQ